MMIKFPKYIQLDKGYKFKIIYESLGKDKFGYIDFENKKIHCNEDNSAQDLCYHFLTIANKDAMSSNYYLQHPSKKQLKYLGKFLMKLVELNKINLVGI